MMKTKFFILAFFLTFIFFFACKKDLQTQFANKFLTSSLRASNENGILKFDSWKDFNNYREHLDSIIKNKDTTDINERLQHEEDRLDFISHRSNLHSAALALQEKGSLDARF